MTCFKMSASVNHGSLHSLCHPSLTNCIRRAPMIAPSSPLLKGSDYQYLIQNLNLSNAAYWGIAFHLNPLLHISWPARSLLLPLLNPAVNGMPSSKTTRRPNQGEHKVGTCNETDSSLALTLSKSLNSTSTWHNDLIMLVSACGL